MKECSRGGQDGAPRDPDKSGRPAEEPVIARQRRSGATPVLSESSPGRPTATTSGHLPTLYFDFIDPLSLAIGHLLEHAGRVAAVEWRPLELAPPPAPLIDPASTAWQQRLAEARRALAPLDLRVESPALLPWTRKAHELCELARDRGRFDALRRAIFRAHFSDGVDIGRIDLLARAAERVGLDHTETRATLDVDRYTDRIERTRATAHTRGVRTVPTLDPGTEGGILAGIGEIVRRVGVG